MGDYSIEKEIASYFTKDVYLAKPEFASMIQTLCGLVDQGLVLAYPMKLLKTVESGADCWDTLVCAFKCPHVMTDEILVAQKQGNKEYGKKSFILYLFFVFLNNEFINSDNEGVNHSKKLL